jgi:flagellar motor switch protein FliN/FliY
MSDPAQPDEDLPDGAALADEQALFASLQQQPEQEAEATAQLQPPAESPPDPSRLELVFDVPVRLSIELGRTELPIRDVVNLGRGSIVELDRAPGAPLDVSVNGVLIGRGELVLVNDERLGLRFTEVVSNADRPKRPG